MDIQRDAGFSKSQTVELREAPVGIQAHTLRGIVTEDGTLIKEGIFEGVLNDRKSNYRCQEHLYATHIMYIIMLQECASLAQLLLVN